MESTVEHAVTSVDSLCRHLRGYDRTLGPAELAAFVSRLHLDRAVLRDFIDFDLEGFQHRSLYRSSLFEVNCISWLAGQESTIHHHRGSACCVRVIEGVLTNIDYTVDTMGSRSVRATELTAGEILSRHDSQVHQLANRQPNERTSITLHLYSPPLLPLEERLCVEPHE